MVLRVEPHADGIVIREARTAGTAAARTAVLIPDGEILSTTVAVLSLYRARHERPATGESA